MSIPNLSQSPPNEQPRTDQSPATSQQMQQQMVLTKEQLKSLIVSIMKSHTGYKVRRLSYGSQVGVIWLTAFVIAFLAYSEIWLVTHNIIIKLISATDPAVASQIFKSLPYGFPTSNEFVTMMTNFNFWFGFTLLLFPVAMYVFSFLIYIDMLFDARLIEISNILNRNSALSRKFFHIYWNKFEGTFEKEVVKLESKANNRGVSLSDRIRKSSDNTLFPPQAYFNAKDTDYLQKKAQKKKAVTMTQLLERLSERMDGSTIKGYFYAFILLQVVVSILFVIPAIEFSGLGYIGADVLIHASGAIGGQTAQYVSFWAIEWAVFGSFVYSFVTLMERIPRRDITPRYYLNIALRYIFAVALSSLFFLIVNQIGVSTQIINENSVTYHGFIAALSFTIGMFPNRYFKILATFVSDRIAGSSTRDIPLEKLTCITPNEATRFWEEGIDSVDQLADYSVNSLYKKTRFEPNHLRSLIGRAIMWKYVFGLENMFVTFLEKPNKAKSQVQNSGIENEVRTCRFADIDSLLYYVFSKPPEKLSHDEIKSILNDETKLAQISEQSGLSAVSLRRAISMAEYFGRQLDFVNSEQTIGDIVKQELSQGIRKILDG